MPVTQPALAQFALSFPLIPGQTNPVPGIGYAINIQWTAGGGPKTIPIVGAGTYVFSLSEIPSTGLQGLLVAVDTTDIFGGTVTAEVQVVFTGGYLWLPPGGSFGLAAPGITSGGITSLSFVTTANAIVHVTPLG